MIKLDDFSYKLIISEGEISEFEIIESPKKAVLYLNSQEDFFPNDEILIKTHSSNQSSHKEVILDEIKINVNAEFEKTNRNGHGYSSDGDCLEGETEISYVKGIVKEVIAQDNKVKFLIDIIETELDNYKDKEFLN